MSKETRAPQVSDGVTSGQGCGHNLFGAASVTAAVAIKNTLQELGLPYATDAAVTRHLAAFLGRGMLMNVAMSMGALESGEGWAAMVQQGCIGGFEDLE